MSKFRLNLMKEISCHMTRDKKKRVLYWPAFTILLLHIFPLISYAQEAVTAPVKVYIAPYKGDAPGAYTLIQDDFGADYAHGIEDYADTIAYNRGIPFCFAVITKECDAADWHNANQLLKHGHQVINHSHSHLCGQPQSWCTFGDWNEKDFPLEIDKSTELIKTNTGIHPAFFIFPFDLFTDTMVTYLADKGYAGTRAGAQNQLQMNSPLNPFRLNFTVLRPDQPFLVCNQFADQAIAKKGWAIRVMHGVEDGSWGAPDVETYRSHIDYLKQKSDQHQLWVATLSDVLWYITLEEKYKVKIDQLDTNKRVNKFSFALRRSVYVYELDTRENEKTLQSTSHIKAITVVVVQPEHKISKITQKDKPLVHTYRDGKLLIEANPEAGEVTIHYTH